MTGARFVITATRENRRPLVVVSGEIDRDNADEFQAALTDAGGDAPELVVDVTGVTNCDTAGLRALFALAATTALTIVVGQTGPLTALLGISGLDRVATVITEE